MFLCIFITIKILLRTIIIWINIILHRKITQEKVHYCSIPYQNFAFNISQSTFTYII